MGLKDKITGRAKQAAGDLTGNEALRREGVEEERKGQAKEDLSEAELRAQREREQAMDTREDARRRAEEAAARELEKGDAVATGQARPATEAESRAERMETEVEARERRT
jgi:uncharacterized protein YjbJ (UPF0337 family)